MSCGARWSSVLCVDYLYCQCDCLGQHRAALSGYMLTEGHLFSFYIATPYTGRAYRPRSVRGRRAACDRRVLPQVARQFPGFAGHARLLILRLHAHALTSDQ
jgi:hypothetical protein